MNPNVKDQGIVLICDQDGTVLRVVRDDLGLSARVHAGSHVNDLVDLGAREKIVGFLAELRKFQAAYGWEITVPANGALLPLNFGGARLETAYVVVAARSPSCLAQVDDELMQINNEQTNAMRATAKDLSVMAEKFAGHDDSVFNELTTLNNEMTNLQREMAQKNAALETLDRDKNRLLGMAAHDLRSPLGVIFNYAQFLESETASVLNVEQREFVTTIKDMSEFMLQMVTDILDVTAIEAGELNLDRQPTDLVCLIQRNVKLNRVLAAQKDITLEFESDRPPPEFSFDAGKVEQVLNNLISNAIKFSHRGTLVRIRLICTDEAVTVAVQDHGQGIPAADFSKLFKAFSQTSVRSTAGEQSTGLGLAIVRRIVEGHGGRIWADSKVGEGSTFSFTLPVDWKNTRTDKLHAPGEQAFDS
jgi:two-component system, OmpR family, sensor kinase